MKFSDALRGAADRAPVDEVQVSTSAVTGRIKRERALRMGANSLVGAGAVAVIAFAAVGPLSGLSDDSAMAGAESVDAVNSADEDAAYPEDGEVYAEGDAPDMASGDMATPQEISYGEALWQCGSEFDPADGLWTWGDTSGVTYTVEEPKTSGWALVTESTLTANRHVSFLNSFDEYVITWNGIVVEHLVYEDSLDYGPDTGMFEPEGPVNVSLEPGTEYDSYERSTQLYLENCWDGAPLPAGKYEVHQAYTLAYVIEDEEEILQWAHPDDDREFKPEFARWLEPFRVAADPVPLIIEGDRLDDPFARYLNGDFSAQPQPLPEPLEPLPIEPLPDGYLTPDIARELFAANAVDSTWDMAPGSQRWVMTHDSKDVDSLWDSNYFGCGWGDDSSATFPTRSAELDLLDVDVNLPARIGVSYGFVVDGNPLVTSTVTNASEFSIPGFWGDAQPQLVLVQDGVVRAMASPQGIDSGLGAAARPMFIEGNGELEPGVTLSGDYLWRDVNGCDSYDALGSVAPGTYTVLAVHSLSVSNHQLAQVRTLPEGVDLHDMLDQAGVLPEEIAPDIEIMPVPGEWDSVELQGWTSLGTVTVS